MTFCLPTFSSVAHAPGHAMAARLTAASGFTLFGGEASSATPRCHMRAALQYFSGSRYAALELAML